VQYDPSDIDAIWDYANLSYHKRKIKKAIQLFQSILELVPYDINVINELVKIYSKTRQVDKAVTLLELAMEADKVFPLAVDFNEMEDEAVVSRISLGVPVTSDLRVVYEELDTLANLYHGLGEYEKIVVVIKEGIRRIHGTSNALLIARGQADREDMMNFDQEV
jgi:tetratricopeptide (TPR) repeat protein